MTSYRAARRALLVERLENRELMAGNVLASLSGNTLTIFGDDQTNSVTLTYDPTTRNYRVAGNDTADGPTSINLQDPATTDNVADFTGVKNVAVLLNGGDDQFDVGSPQAVDMVIAKWLSIDMGDGNDQLVLGRAGNAPGGVDPVATSLRTGTSLSVNLGAGDDEFHIANARIGQSLNIFAGDGNDHVLFDTEFTPAGATGPTLFPVRVKNSATINLAGGDDELIIKNASFQKNLRILDGGGTADIELHNVNVAKKLSIDTFDEADQITVDSVRARQLTMNTNGGVDDVDVTNSRFTAMNLKLGSARDHLLVQNTKSSFLTHFDGGQQGSTLVRGPGNRLRGLTRRDIG
jgi:hypothetical protein